MGKVVDRWNTFSRAGKVILVVFCMMIFAGVYAGISVHNNRINIVGKTYVVRTVAHPEQSETNFKFEKGGVFKGSDKYSPQVTTLSYKFDQKSITLYDKTDKDIKMKIINLEKKSDGTILGDFKIDGVKPTIKMVFAPKK
jgi:hypothetical protein